jgi:hypothetical protein
MRTSFFVAAIIAITLTACATQATRSAAQTAAPAPLTGYASSNFVGQWTCNWTNGKYTVVDTATIRADGTTVGYGTAYGHQTPTYENSWSYAPSGATTGTMSSKGATYTETSSVNWLSPNHYTMVVLTDVPNTSSVGAKMDCTRTQ